MLQHAAGGAPSGTGAEKAGVKIGHGKGAVIDACRVQGFAEEGIYLGESVDGTVRCKVVHNLVKDTGKASIYLTSWAKRCAVIGNTVENAGNGTIAYGIYVDGDRNVVQGNDVAPHDEVPAPPSQTGIRLGGNADYCIVTGNQTNGFGINISDAANNTEANNRDDA